MKTSGTQIVILGIFIFFLVVGVFIFATFGTSNQEDPAEQIEIWGTLPIGSIVKVLNTVKDQYRNETIPTITYREIKKDIFETTLVEALADGEGPDVILIPSDLITANQKRLTIIGYDLLSQRNFKDSFIEGSEILLTSEGSFGVPLLVDPLVMYWNRDMLTSKGIARAPISWEEMLSIINRLTERNEDKTIVKSALAFGDFANIKYAKDILISLIIQSGGLLIGRDDADKLVNQILEIKVDDAYPLNNAISFFTQFSDPLKPVYSWNRSLPDSEQAFLNGDLAFYFAPASEMANISSKNPNLNFDVASVPQSEGSPIKKTSGQIYSFSILDSSQGKQAAYQAISILSDSSSSQIFSSEIGLPSARRDLLSVSNESVEDVYMRSAIWTFPWLDPNAKQTELIFREAVDSVVTGKTRIDNIAGFISSKIEELLR